MPNSGNNTVQRLERRQDYIQMQEILQDIRAELAKANEQLSTLSTRVKDLEEKYAEVEDIFKGFKSFARVLSGLEWFSKKLIAISVACGFIWAAWKYGVSNALGDLPNNLRK